MFAIPRYLRAIPTWARWAAGGVAALWVISAVTEDDAPESDALKAAKKPTLEEAQAAINTLTPEIAFAEAPIRDFATAPDLSKLPYAPARLRFDADLIDYVHDKPRAAALLRRLAERIDDVKAAQTAANPMSGVKVPNISFGFGF